MEWYNQDEEEALERFYNEYRFDYPAVWPWVEDPHRVVEPDYWAEFFKVIPDERYFEGKEEAYDDRKEQAAADRRMEMLETELMAIRTKLRGLEKKDLPETTGLAERYTKEV